MGILSGMVGQPVLISNQRAQAKCCVKVATDGPDFGLLLAMSSLSAGIQFVCTGNRIIFTVHRSNFCLSCMLESAPPKVWSFYSTSLGAADVTTVHLVNEICFIGSSFG